MTVAAADLRRPMPRWRSGLLILGLILLPFVLTDAGAALSDALGRPVGAQLVLGTYLVVLTVFVLRRADCWMWATFLSGVVTHTLLWQIADDAGAPLLVGHVVAFDRALGLGTLPTHWLQAHMPAAGVVNLLLFGVYISFFAISILL